MGSSTTVAVWTTSTKPITLYLSCLLTMPAPQALKNGTPLMNDKTIHQGRAVFYHPLRQHLRNELCGREEKTSHPSRSCRLKLGQHMFLKIFGQPSLTGLLIDRRQIVSCFFHHLHYSVERNAMVSIRKSSI